MPELILYLLKVNVALLLFYLAYHVALRRLTFYHLNRLFLVFGILFSTVYPLIDLSGLFQNDEQMEAAYLVSIPAWAYAPPTTAAVPETFDLWQLPVYLFWMGVAVMLGRFIVQLLSLYRIHATSEPATYKAVPFRKVQSVTQAFSFWQTIYLNPAQHKTAELESILRHELIHITGWHTLDVLLSELSVVFYWFNPGAWLMKKAVKENLEFIADQHVVHAGVDKKEYQYLLLKVVGATQPQIANQFNFPSLKRRIAMMNKMPTHKANRLRLLIALPLAASLLFAFRTATPVTEAITSIESGITQQDGKNTTELIKQLKSNPAIKSVRTKKVDGREAILISPKGGGTEVYYIGDAASIAELKQKYMLSEPPSPPATRKEAQEEAAIAKVVMPMENHYFIDGVKSSKEAALALDGEAIHSMSIIKGEAAQQLLGDETATGAASIITKLHKDSKQVQDFQKKLQAASAGAKEKLPPPAPVQSKAGQTSGLPESATYYVDGVQVSTEAMEELDPKQIHSVNVIKGDAAKELFGAKGGSGVISITTEKNKDSQRVIEFNKKISAGTSAKPGASIKVEQQELPPPPAPVRYNGPAIPKAGGARVVENEEYIVYTLWPEEITKRELEIAKQAFQASGFKFDFEEKYEGGKINSLNIDLISGNNRSKANAVYSAASIRNLLDADNIVLVQANKKTGEVSISHTLAPR